MEKAKHARRCHALCCSLMNFGEDAGTGFSAHNKDLLTTTAKKEETTNSSLFIIGHLFTKWFHAKIRLRKQTLHQFYLDEPSNSSVKSEDLVRSQMDTDSHKLTQST